jgi:hypothetical protein
MAKTTDRFPAPPVTPDSILFDPPLVRDEAALISAAEMKLIARRGYNPVGMMRGEADFVLNDADANKRDAQAERERIDATPFDPDKWVTLKPRPWVYGKHYIRGFVTGTSAPTKTGKSTVGMVEDVSMMTGFDLLGVGAANMPPNGKRLKVWIWNGEDPEDELVRRLKAICLYYGKADFNEDPDGGPSHARYDFTFQDLRHYLYLDSGRDSPLKVASLDNGNVKIAVPVVKSMIATIERNGIDVVSLDPFITAHKVPENSERMDEVVGAFKDIAYQTGCAIEHVHHTRKTIREEVTSADSRGSSSIVAAWRDSRVLNFMDEATAKEQGIKNRFRYLRLGSDAGNMTVRGEGGRWVYMESVCLNNAADGLPADDVGVAVPWEPAVKSAEAKATDEARIVMAALKLMDDGKRVTRERGGDYTLKTFVEYLDREDSIKATVDEVRGVLDRACEGRVLLEGEKVPIRYNSDPKRGSSGYVRRLEQ